MNIKTQNGFREFNPPAVIVARLSFLLMLLGWGASVVLFVAGAASHNVLHSGAGVGVGALAFAIRGWLRRTHRWTDVLDSIGNFGVPDSPSTEFSQQVHEWETMRFKRGTPGFDAWEFLRLQREIESKAKEDPRLAAFWHDRQS